MQAEVIEIPCNRERSKAEQPACGQQTEQEHNSESARFVFHAISITLHYERMVGYSSVSLSFAFPVLTSDRQVRGRGRVGGHPLAIYAEVESWLKPQWRHLRHPLVFSIFQLHFQ